MTLQGYYYLKYPDTSPDDPSNAATEMYVEVVRDGETLATTYAVMAYTYKYIDTNFVSKDEPLLESNFVLVPTLEDDWMEFFLSQNLHRIARIGNIR